MMLVPDALNLGTQRVIALEKRGRGLDGDQWKASTSFGLKDLVNLTKAALLAHSAILKQVTNGLAVRMAVLHLLCGQPEG